jgi:hypothetical protein
MKHAAELAAAGTILIPILVIIGSGVQILIRGDLY